MRAPMLILAAAAGVWSATPAHAQDLEKGAELYQGACRACHGPTAKGLASYPKLAGQSYEHIVRRLRQYRAGDRIGPNTPLMTPQAEGLSDADIDDVATYIAQNFK